MVTGAADGGVLIGSSVSPVTNFINYSSLAIFRCHPRWEQHKVIWRLFYSIHCLLNP
jgi:hypothetical protein